MLLISSPFAKNKGTVRVPNVDIWPLVEVLDVEALNAAVFAACEEGFPAAEVLDGSRFDSNACNSEYPTSAGI